MKLIKCYIKTDSAWILSEPETIETKTSYWKKKWTMIPFPAVFILQPQ